MNMIYTQKEVDLLLQQNTLEFIEELKVVSRETKRKLQKKGNFLSSGNHLYFIPKHILLFIKQRELVFVEKLLKTSHKV